MVKLSGFPSAIQSREEICWALQTSRNWVTPWLLWIHRADAIQELAKAARRRRVIVLPNNVA